MRFVIQRVTQGSVEVKGEIISSIKHGYVILVGIYEDDTIDDAQKAVQKIVNIRIMSDETGKMNKSLKDVAGEILFVSQFTLCADLTFGRRPSFIKAMQPDKAEPLYKTMVEEFEKEGIKTQTGKFGNYMTVKIENDGPVTIILDTKKD
jgi:D-tyrosyl-tRNA(Tyr) deacylase